MAVPQQEQPGPGAVVLDTNIVLDLLVFDDPSTRGLAQALEAKAVEWLACGAMRGELERVLGYAHIVARLLARGRSADEVLARFDAACRVVAPPPSSAVHCRDRDDQVFVDLAVRHGALLLSKDLEVLSLRKPLAVLGVRLASAYAATTSEER